MAHVNEVAHTLNSFQSIQHASKSSLLGDGTERLVRSPAGHRRLMSSSMVPPLWNEEDEEREEAMSPTDATNRMIPLNSNRS